MGLKRRGYVSISTLYTSSVVGKVVREIFRLTSYLASREGGGVGFCGLAQRQNVFDGVGTSCSLVSTFIALVDGERGSQQRVFRGYAVDFNLLFE